jgi:hypothetical protein
MGVCSRADRAEGSFPATALGFRRQKLTIAVVDRDQAPLIPARRETWDGTLDRLAKGDWRPWMSRLQVF